MKTEDLIRYERMYAAIEAALGTPWLRFAHCQQSGAEASEAAAGGGGRILRERPESESLQAPNSDDGWL